MQVPAAYIVAGHLFHKIILGHGKREAIALAATELDVQLPRGVQAVFLHVEQPIRLDRKTAIDLGFGHRGPPPQRKLAGRTEGRFDHLIWFLRFANAIVAGLVQ